MFLFYKSMVCAVYLQENWRCKIQKKCKLSTRYTTEDKRVWHYCNSNYSITEIDLILLLLKEEYCKYYSCTSNNCYRSRDMTLIWFCMMSWSHMDAMSMSHRHRMFTKLNLYPVILPKLNLLTAILKRFYLIV